MLKQPRSRALVVGGVVVGALIALVLAAGVPGPRDEPGSAVASGGPAQRTADSRDKPEGGGVSEAVSMPPPEPPQEAYPMPQCWEDLPRLDQALTLESFRSALTLALSREDRLLLKYLEARLTRMVGDEPRNALQVLSWVEESSGGLDLIVYMEALKKAPAVQHKKVAGRLLELAEDPQRPLALRAASVIGLETQKHFDAEALKRMRALALDPKEDQVAWNATRTIGRVMETEFKSTGRYQPYWEQLLDISQNSEERSVRGLALEMPTYPEVILDEKSIVALSEILRTDRDREIRELAAMRLSVTEAPDKALAAYRAAFPTENEFCVRWALLRYAFRAAGPAALPLAEQFAQQEPRLQQDYLDFKELYAQGTLDWERIWLNKKLYPDHIACMDSHQEGQ